MDYSKIPSAIYIEPEIASVGLTEEQAKEKYGDVKVGRFPLVANGKAKAAGNERGMVKVIIDEKYGDILGVHLYCIHGAQPVLFNLIGHNKLFCFYHNVSFVNNLIVSGNNRLTRDKSLSCAVRKDNCPVTMYAHSASDIQ